MSHELIYERDGHRCPHCGHRATSVQHRINRQMGGSKNTLRHAPSNLLAFCWLGNTQMESNTETAQQALEFGWKLPSNAVPSEHPFYDATDRVWYVIDDEYNRTPTYGPPLNAI